MKNFFSIIVIFAILLVGGGYVYMQQQGEKSKAKVANDLSEARKSFAHKARAAANEEDTEDYLRAVRASLTSYQDELKSVYKGNEELRTPEAYKEKVEGQFKEGKLDEAQKKSMIEGYELVRTSYDTLKSGNWKPVFTQKGKGDTRLDIYTLRRTATPDGQPVLEGDFFFWGIEDSTDVRWGNLEIRLWTTEKQMVKEGRKKVEKDVEIVLGKQEGESQPHIMVQRPANYIAEFPSFVSIGRVWFPVPPAPAQSMDLVFGYLTKGYGGGEAVSELRWEKVPIPGSWKLRDDEVWDADEVEATEDEIAGRDPNAPDGGTEEETAN